MRILRARPLATATMSAMAAAILSFFFDARGKIFLVSLVWILTAAFCLFFLMFKRHRCPATAWIAVISTCIAISVTVLSALYHFHMSANIPSYVVDDGDIHTVELRIEEDGNAGVGYSYFTISLHSIDGQKVNGKATLECEYAATYHPGDVLLAAVEIQGLETYYDAHNLYYAIADGIHLALLHAEGADVQIKGHEQMSFRRFFARLQDELSSRLLSLVGKKHGGLAAALFLGERDLLDQRITTDFRRAGVSHLLALSGMHVTLLMALVAALAVKIGLPKRGRLILLSVLVLGYLALVGFRLSAVRAVGMLLLFYCAQMLGTGHDPLTTLCVIGWGMLSVMPSTVADGGFWMSFSAVFGLVAVLPKFNAWLESSRISKRTHRFVQGIAASSIAVVSVSFCTWLFCGEIAPIGILLTVVLTPLLTCVLTLIVPILLLDILPFFSAAPLVPFLSAALRWMTSLTSHVSEWRNISFSLRTPYTGGAIALMSVILLAMLLVPLRRKWLLIFPPVLASIFVVATSLLWQKAQFGNQIQLNYVTQTGGSVLTVADKEGCAVIDTSAGSFSTLRLAEKALRDSGETEIEHLILTHYHRAYTYSAERFAKRNMLRYLWIPMPQNETEYLCLRALYERLEPLGTEIRCYDIGEQITLFGSAVFSVADVSYIERSSQPILTYLLQTSGEILTFSSPVVHETAYYPTFRWICDRTDVLIMGEHGPRIKQQISPIGEDAHPALVLTDIEDPRLDLPDAVVVSPTESYAFSMIK